jgi:hypothetical protein
MHTKFKSEKLKGRDHMINPADRGRIQCIYHISASVLVHCGAGFDIQRRDFMETVIKLGNLKVEFSLMGNSKF